MPAVELPALYVDNVAAIVAIERPVLVNRDPGPGETGVPLESAIALEVVDPGPDGIGVVVGDHPAESGGDQHVGVQGEQLGVADRLGAHEVHDGAGLDDVVHQPGHVDPVAGEDAAVGVGERRHFVAGR